MKIKKLSIYVFIILTIIIYKNNIINLISKTKINPSLKTEIIILKEENKFLKQELNNITNLKLTSNYNYDLTRLLYKATFDESEFYIIGGINKNYEINNLLINQNGVVGIITEVYDSYSKCKYIYNIKNLAVVVNNAYGTLNQTENNLLIVNNISNYDKVSLNDEVYTSPLGSIKEKMYLGYVYDIKDTEKGKKLYIKSEVDFYNINYLYVVGVTK